MRYLLLRLVSSRTLSKGLSMSTLRLSVLSLLAVTLVGANSASLSAQDVAAKGREIHAQHASAVVSIAGNVNLDIEMMGQQEAPVALLGTVVDASGLVLTSLASLNPIGEEPMTMEPQPGMEITITARIGDLWIDLPGGKRMQIETVLLDPLNDVALLRPKDAAEATELGKLALKATPAAELPGILTPVVVLGRLGEEANRVATVRIDHVAAAIETPRPCVLLPGEVGSPVFDAAGRLVGVITTLASGEELDIMAMMNGMGAGGATVVSPWSAMQTVIDQAKAKTSEAKPAEGQ